MKKILFALLLAIVSSQAFTQTPTEKRYSLYGVCFYNLENLFDTIHAPGKNDFEYLPDGGNRWGTMKYRAKVKNMATVLADLCSDRLKGGPAVVGVSEVENREVLEDLLREPCLKDRGWQVIHIEGPDRRGVDCGILYNPKLFHLEQTMLVPYYYLSEDQPDVDLGFYTNEEGKVTCVVTPHTLHAVSLWLPVRLSGKNSTSSYAIGRHALREVLCVSEQAIKYAV